MLAPVKMIAEPWDTAGYTVGGFPAAGPSGTASSATRRVTSGRARTASSGSGPAPVGSGDLYSSGRRTPAASVNFITAHDGFTLADLTSYNEKHNEANGEDNNDGESDNRSWNGGAEGPTDDMEINELGRRSEEPPRHAPPLRRRADDLGGDEIGRSQGGNNNAYCQDNEISWRSGTPSIESCSTSLRT